MIRHTRRGLEKERQELQAVVPRADIPDVLIEIFARTGAVDCFTHISGATSRMDDLEVSVCAVLLAEAANIGLTPVVNPAVRTLRAGGSGT